MQIGAHPGYPDLQGFGRRVIPMTSSELSSSIKYQVAALKGLVESKGHNLAYVKPHGALYNEMAQNEAVTGDLQANYWLHNSFVKFNNNKMSKSLNGFISLEDLKKKGYNCMDYRFLVLQTHYKKSLNFTWKSLEAAKRGLKNIIKEIAFYDKPLVGCSELEGEFYKAMSDDLNTSQALAILQKVIDSNYPSSAKLKSILKIDEVLGLGLKKLRVEALNIPIKYKKILKKRSQARKNKDWILSDKLRKELESFNIEVQDNKVGQRAIKIN